MAVSGTRALPLRVRPASGEAIDSWLETIAARMRLPLGVLAQRLNLAALTRPRWIVGLSDWEAEALATATATTGAAIKAMTLAAYDGRALQINAETLRLEPDFPYGPILGSRYCPDCLSASAGRWQLAWRLGWSFACTRHRRLLADSCPRCGARPRSQQTYRDIPTPTQCQCGQDLTRTTTAQLPSDHPIIEGQRRLDALLVSDDVAFGVFAPSTPRREALETIRSLSNRTLNYTAMHGLSSVTAARLGDAQCTPPSSGKPLRGRNALNPAPPRTAMETAVGVAAALDILGASSVRTAGYRARWLIDGQNADTGPAEMRSCSRDVPVATAIIARASDARLGPELQLRYRVAITVPCAPDIDRGQAQIVAAALPTMMWSKWSMPLLQDVGDTAATRSALSIATVLTGSVIKPVEAASMLGEHVSTNAVNSRLWVLRSSNHWRPMCAALIRLSDYLRRSPAPIDYNRRRSLDYSELLGDPAWETISRQLSRSSRDHRARAIITRYLVERLSGSPAAGVKPAASRSRTRALVDNAFPEVPKIEHILDHYANAFLRTCGVNEPVYWYPPLVLLDGLFVATPSRANKEPH